jgi:hypothetical protein
MNEKSLVLNEALAYIETNVPYSSNLEYQLAKVRTVRASASSKLQTDVNALVIESSQSLDFLGICKNISNSMGRKFWI